MKRLLFFALPLQVFLLWSPLPVLAQTKKLSVCLNKDTGAITARRKCKAPWVSVSLNVIKATGLPGATGETGPKGPKGDTGAQGANGRTGATGPQGVKGDQGPQGLQGQKGDKGDVGPQGAQGLQGVKGDQGLQGLEGEKGDKGDVGPQGPAGERGPSAFDTLPSGTTVRGVMCSAGFDIAGDATAVSFPAPIPQPITFNDVIIAPTPAFNSACTTRAHCLTSSEVAKDASLCTGTPEVPTAPPGKVCIYPLSWRTVSGALINAEPVGDSSIYGFLITSTLYYMVRATWAYTAP